MACINDIIGAMRLVDSGETCILPSTAGLGRLIYLGTANHTRMPRIYLHSASSTPDFFFFHRGMGEEGVPVTVEFGYVRG